MLGELFLCFKEEVVERKRHRCYERGQVGENEGQGLNSEAHDSCEEGLNGRKKKVIFGGKQMRYVLLHVKGHSLSLAASFPFASRGV